MCEISGVIARFYKLEVRCNVPDVHSAPRASSSSKKSETRGKKRSHDIKEEE